RVVQIGFAALFAGIVIMVALLDISAGPEIVTWPMLLAGFGVGALASQLGSVTVSAVPDEQSGEVGGIQNTVTNLGASIGTALAGAVLISALTSSFLTGVMNNPAVPKDVASRAQGELGGGIPSPSPPHPPAAPTQKAGAPSQAPPPAQPPQPQTPPRGARPVLSPSPPPPRGPPFPPPAASPPGSPPPARPGSRRSLAG